ncbi:MAG: NAD-dependent epimerase/dehydratase family protein [bacterium]
MNILVTGATGFIGLNLIPELLKKKYKVIALTKTSLNFSKLKLYSDNKNLEFYNLEKNNLEKIFKEVKIDIVIHLATYYKKKHVKNDIKNIIQSNIEFPTEILQLMIDYGVKYFINTGTFFEHALDINEPIAEEHPENPYNLYASTKIAFEDILRFYTEQFPISASTLRLFSPYGPFEHEYKIIPVIIKNVFEKTPINFNSSGFQRWDYIFIQDITEAFIKTIDFIVNNNIKHEIFNIGTGKAFSLREIFENINRIGKTNIPVIWGHDMNKEIKYACADITKAKRLLGWEPRFDIYTGLEITYNWFKQNITSGDIN